ncbi:helix-turn-helix transcriptional regulator [Cohnella silvisoli]|uniref:AraC family transcriptional regulator n=1 Tax=Cohnella silvisoli TaxID=2873699 RepID=A0ABV1KL60_9BACL|nr:AraC family transcriptional regulator [Cohnella silvisoli]MCD9020788.1 AraC family transcriptional regulator [Cohnella silvisoli]
MNPGHHYYSHSINPSPIEGEITVLFSGEGQPRSLHKMGPTIHDYYLIHTVLSGQGEFNVRDQRYRCNAGDTFIIFPGELFSYQADEHQPWQYVWIAFVGHGAAALMDSIGISRDDPVITGSPNPNIREYYSRLHSCFQSDSLPELSNLESGGWVRLLFQQLGLAKRRLEAANPPAVSLIDHTMKQAIQFLTLQFSQTISIEHMSNVLGYHRTHLCKLFKQTTGLSPMQYLLKIRMERAEQLLTTPMTIDQVASSVGFGDALYFSRKFRKWRGQSPSEYRKTLRNVPQRS